MIRLLHEETKKTPIFVNNMMLSVEYHYLTYRGDSKEEALKFLDEILEIPPYTYYAVEINEQAYCKDCMGSYEEKAKFLHIKEKE